MKSVLITGANKGIGFETTKYLLQHEYFVFLGCRNTTLGNEAMSKLKEAGLINCEIVEIDVTSQPSVDRAKDVLSCKIPSLDVLINNAGILGRLPTPENQLTVADIKYVFDTNFFGTIRTIDAFLPLLKKSLHPRIVNVTSDLGSLTLHTDSSWEYFNYKGLAYGPSKTAINAYTIALAYQLRETNFKVNCVTPGHTATDFNNYRGKLKPEDTCKIIARCAMLDDNAQSGKFFGAGGEIPW